MNAEPGETRVDQVTGIRNQLDDRCCPYRRALERGNSVHDADHQDTLDGSRERREVQGARVVFLPCGEVKVADCRGLGNDGPPGPRVTKRSLRENHFERDVHRIDSMIKHLPQRSRHARPTCLFPIDRVHGLVDEQSGGEGPVYPARQGVSFVCRVEPEEGGDVDKDHGETHEGDCVGRNVSREELDEVVPVRGEDGFGQDGLVHARVLVELEPLELLVGELHGGDGLCRGERGKKERMTSAYLLLE